MKKLFFLFLLFSPIFIFAQPFASLNIFSENGDKFYLYLDGKKQNDIARSNIRVEDLPDLYYAAKIVFEDAAIAPVSKNNLYVSDGDDVMKDATYKIRREKNSKPKLSFYSMLPVKQNFVPGADMYVFHYNQPAVFETIPVVEKKEEVLAVSPGKSLGSLNVFSQNADKFYLYLNGVKQNDVAQSNVRISNIPGLYYNVRIVFKDSKLATIVKNNVVISDGEDNLMDAVYRVRRDNTGRPRFNFYAMTAVKENFTAPNGMFVYDFEKADSASNNKTAAATTNTNASKKNISTVKGSITNLKVSDPVSPYSSSKTTAKNSNKQSNTRQAAEPTATAGKPVVATETKKDNTTAAIPGNKKCNGWPMGKGDLAAGKKMIEQGGTEEEKLSIAQDFIVSNCLTASQVIEFCSMFKSEKSKLAFAKYAYKFTIDRNNYAEVNKTLSLEKSKKELNKFISGS